jgi:hypothetical protein
MQATELDPMNAKAWFRRGACEEVRASRRSDTDLTILALWTGPDTLYGKCPIIRACHFLDLYSGVAPAQRRITQLCKAQSEFGELTKQLQTQLYKRLSQG